EVKNLVTRFDIRGGLLGRKTGAIHAVEDVSFNLFQAETLSSATITFGSSASARAMKMRWR
ncbi:hypothetical protein ACCS72_37605, partial [Rhizobium ruizarguesonis]